MTDVVRVYTGRSTNWPMLWLSSLLAVPLLVMGAMSKGAWASASFLIPVAIMLLALVFNLLTTSSLRTAVGPNGVTVRFGLLGLPRFCFRLNRIMRADVVELPLQSSMWWGIWWTPSQGLLLTLRHGPALRLTLHGGRTVTISMPEPGQARAALLAQKR
ncbi:MAG: hypothetical protein QM753_18360 [Thermomicrobiales bacterium]